MFFVVYMDETGENTKIYYKKFLPFDIKSILKRYGHQESRTVIFEAFPTEISKITDVFIAFAYDMKKQRATIDFNDEKILTALKNGENTVEITFGWPVSLVKKNPLEDFFEHGFYLYANYIGNELKFPIGYIDHIERMDQTRECSVTVKNKLFYDRVKVGLLENTTEIQIGKSIKMIGYREKDWKEDRVAFSLSGTLLERINAIEFLLAMLQAEQFEIDGDVYHINKEEMIAPENLKLFSLKEYLEYLLLVKQTLGELSVTQDLEWDVMSEKDHADIQSLKKAVIDNELIPLSLEGSGYGFYSIANLHILVIAGEERKGRFKIHNFFDDRITMEVKLDDGNQYKIAPCVFLSKEDLLKCSNLNAKNIILSIVNTPISEINSNYLTQFLLKLLKAYDESCSQREDILDIALEISDWIEKKDTFCSGDISKINRYQVIKRSRELNDEEISDLVELTEGRLDKEEYYVGAYLLLDNQKAAAVHFNRMTVDEQETFRHYPIYRFSNDAF